MLLTHEEITEVCAGHYNEATEFARALERAVLEKLCAGVEMPEPIKFGIDFRADDPRPIGHTPDQMLAYGAAQRLKALEDAAVVCDEKAISKRLWLNESHYIECRDAIRALKGEA